MKRNPILYCSVALLFAALPALVLASDQASRQDVIKYREAIMKTMNQQAAALGQIASTVIPQTNLTAHFEIIALTASAALQAFKPDVPGGKAKPEIWSNWPDFSKRMAQFVQDANGSVKIAEAQGMDGALTQMVALANDCKACHDKYRQPQTATP